MMMLTNLKTQKEIHFKHQEQLLLASKIHSPSLLKILKRKERERGKSRERERENERMFLGH